MLTYSPPVECLFTSLKNPVFINLSFIANEIGSSPNT